MGKSSWEATKEYYQFRCCYCFKKTRNLTMDHLTPKSRGGDKSIDNIAPACIECNQKKANNPIWVMLYG